MNIRQLPNIELDITTLEALWHKSTAVVAWYPYGYDGTVRGPFCRWFTCSKIDEQYEKHCGSIEDDVKYTAMALNSVPHLIVAHRAQSDRIAQLEGQLRMAKIEAQVFADRVTALMEKAKC